MPREFANNPNGSPTSLREWAENLGMRTNDLAEVARDLNTAFSAIQGSTEDTQRNSLRTLFMQGYHYGMTAAAAAGGRRGKKTRRTRRK